MGGRCDSGLNLRAFVQSGSGKGLAAERHCGGAGGTSCLGNRKACLHDHPMVSLAVAQPSHVRVVQPLLQ